MINRSLNFWYLYLSIFIFQNLNYDISKIICKPNSFITFPFSHSKLPFSTFHSPSILYFPFSLFLSVSLYTIFPSLSFFSIFLSLSLSLSLSPLIAFSLSLFPFSLSFSHSLSLSLSFSLTLSLFLSIYQFNYLSLFFLIFFISLNLSISLLLFLTISLCISFSLHTRIFWRVQESEWQR